MAHELSQAEDALLAEVCLNYRQWAPGEAAPPTVTARRTGARNTLVQLRGAGGAWVLRIASAATPPGACRTRELRHHRAAAARGLAPAVVFCDSARGLLLTEFHPNEAAREPQRLASPAAPASDTRRELGELADLLRRIHALPQTSGFVSPAQHLARAVDYVPANSPLGARLHGLKGLLKRLRALLADKLADKPARTALCHNDLLRANRLRSQGVLMAIDWEYACAGDPLFDLAVCASELSRDRRAALLDLYLQRAASREERRRFAARQLAYALIAACWHAAFDAAGEACRAASAQLEEALETGADTL